MSVYPSELRRGGANVKMAIFHKTTLCVVLLLSASTSSRPATAGTIESQWLYVNIRALPQTVEVHTRTGSYLTIFQVNAQVFRNEEARGFIDLSEADGTPHRFQVISRLE